MDLSKLIEKKADYAQYMFEEIKHICTKFEKRDPGSNGEKQACEYMGGVLKDLGCDKVDVESFKENPKSFYGWIYITITCVLAAIALFFCGTLTGNVVLPIIGVVLIVFGLALALLQFGVYKKTVDALFPEKTGHNVTALKKPTGEVKRRIIFNGHPDAAWEWPVNYKLGGVGFEGHAILCAVGAVFYIVLNVLAAVKVSSGAEVDGLVKVGLWGLLFVPFLVGLYFMVNYKIVVDGANDNLSGFTPFTYRSRKGCRLNDALTAPQSPIGDSSPYTGEPRSVSTDRKGRRSRHHVITADREDAIFPYGSQ